MKKIKPLQIWTPGNTKDATLLSVTLTGDNLKDSAFLSWQLIHEDSNCSLSHGTVSISGDEYLKWDGSNDFAFQFVADQIGVEIVK